jgi:hypothetical protein
MGKRHISCLWCLWQAVACVIYSSYIHSIFLSSFLGLSRVLKETHNRSSSSEIIFDTRQFGEILADLDQQFNTNESGEPLEKHQ